MSEWVTRPLSVLADVRVSNVDKKSLPGEKPVLLCNYMDAYANDYIRSDITFMEATASAAEIAKFKVDLGDVVVTKDSETPDDIGIPAVVTEQIDNLVCGYHLALLKTRQEFVDPVFLCKQLGSHEAARYFGQRAAGSTRYGLSNGALANFPVSLPGLPTQKKIATILTGIDTAIEKTEALIAKYQQIKAGLMHDLFTRGVLPNGQLRPPREQAPELYQETAIGWIPKEWQYELLDKLALRGSGHTPNKNFPEYWNGGIKWVSLADSHRLDQLYISDTELQISQKGIQNSSAVLHPAGIVVLSRDAGVGKSAITTEPMAVSQHFMCWKCDQKMDNHFLYYWLQLNKRTFENIAMGSTILTIGLQYFKKMKIACPVDLGEQRNIAANLKASDTRIFSLQDALSKLKQQKQGLMHDLLTGKVPVKVEEPEVLDG